MSSIANLRKRTFAVVLVLNRVIVRIFGMPGGIRHVQHPCFGLTDIHDKAWNRGWHLYYRDSETVLDRNVDLFVVPISVFQDEASCSSNSGEVIPTLHVKMGTLLFPRKATV